MSDRPFDRFILLAEMRTGSNFLEANLNALAGVTCHGEAFNPGFIGKQNRHEYLGLDLAGREADPLELMRRMEAATEGIAGFRFFHDHDARVLAACLADRRCAKIVLTRNPVESYVSLEIARATGQWKLGDGRRRKSAQVAFDAARFESHMQALQAFQLHVLNVLQTSGQTAFYLDYEDIGDVAVLNGLARWLGVAARLDAPVDTLKKQNPEEIARKVSNPAQMEAALAQLDRFNLSRTPSFEPRRGAGVPGFVAAAGAPVLYMPLRGGPEEQVTGWLASLSRGGAAPGLEQGFSQKSLRQWMRRSPGFRSFTVLRHPLARAHDAFCRRILTGRYAEIRGTLKRAYKLDLPDPDRLAAQPATAHRAAFLGFLGFLRLNLAGQTGVRIDAAWASQSAVLQGFAQFAPPDLVLHEDRLEAGLGFLAAEVGAGAPPLPPPPPGGAVGLADICDDEIEEAAREAYVRDYLTFGFGNWRDG
ncbi:MAG: nodulation protein NodH [Gemmobacter sp.]